MGGWVGRWVDGWVGEWQDVLVGGLCGWVVFRTPPVRPISCTQKVSRAQKGVALTVPGASSVTAAVSKPIAALRHLVSYADGARGFVTTNKVAEVNDSEFERRRNEFKRRSFLAQMKIYFGKLFFLSFCHRIFDIQAIFA